MKIKVILIHGNGGSTAKDHWFPWVKKELEKLNLEVIAQNFPDSQFARAGYWLPFLKNTLKADKHTILIGHSSGAVAALRFAEKNQVLGSILVGVNYTDLGDETEEKSGYYDRPWDWQTIKKNQKWIVIFASQNDPYISISEPWFIHQMLSSEYHEYLDQGHFGSPKEKLNFPEMITVVKSHIDI